MSTIKVNSIQTAGGLNGLTLNANGQVNVANTIAFGTSVIGASSASTMKNRFINGDMRIDQRNAGAALTSVGVTAVNYPLDRTMFLVLGSATGRTTCQRSTDAPAGFTNSFYSTVTTAEASLSGFEGFAIQQKIEGFNISDFDYGLSTAKTTTTSFWVKSSVVGNYAYTLMNDAGTQAYTATYTINSANTWEYKTITIPGSTSGSWYKDNNTGLYCVWGLGGATNRTATSTNAWVSGPAGGYTPTQAPGCVSWIANNGATFYITGIQLEVGSASTSFDFRHYQQELAMCQRYFVQFGASANEGPSGFAGHWSTASVCRFPVACPVPMRTSPSVTFLNPTTAMSIYRPGTSQASPGSDISSEEISYSGFIVNGGTTSGTSTTGFATHLRCYGAGKILASAEL